MELPNIPPIFIGRILLILVGIFNSFPQFITDEENESSLNIRESMRQVANQLPIDEIIKLFDLFISEADVKSVGIALTLLELAVQYDESIFLQLLEKDFSEKFQDLMINTPNKVKIYCIHFSYECIPYFYCQFPDK